MTWRYLGLELGILLLKPRCIHAERIVPFSGGLERDEERINAIVIPGREEETEYMNKRNKQKIEKRK